MSAWTDSLNAADIRDPELRRDYSAQRQLVSRFRRTSYLAAQALLPRPLLPHVVMATAVMHHGDNLLDTGPKAHRAARWMSWEEQVRNALETKVSGDPLIRTLVHTVAAHPQLLKAVEVYLSTAPAELQFSGFDDEAAYQGYVDAYSLPAFMLIGSLLGPKVDDGRYRAACRAFIDGSQRLDFVNDIAEDVVEGRIGIPTDTLQRFSITMEDLAAGREVPAVRNLVYHQVSLAQLALKEAQQLPALTAAPSGPLMETLLEVEMLTAKAVRARGAKLLRGSATPPLVATLGALLRARRKIRKAG
ncbi:squalene/phytoene synthase family protein [Streptomyces sp. SP2-10]|uniref:squalene/phytoene synthase family protein n=1 Tax=Streptomyces sp. SP2-10 TaxID=2873385 RepID=UPI001CA6CF9D|nr:squalene/phytoene synthase family protein [Streptomyces sp. SP2-10]MBY8846669.1 squalene/phytoene synthase family protein [Streptomyces sp. SP2-10]